jgi:hypothetical protein
MMALCGWNMLLNSHESMDYVVIWPVIHEAAVETVFVCVCVWVCARVHVCEMINWCSMMLKYSIMKFCMKCVLQGIYMVIAWSPKIMFLLYQ